MGPTLVALGMGPIGCGMLFNENGRFVTIDWSPQGAEVEVAGQRLDDLVVVGNMKSDADLAAGIGARYFDAETFVEPE